MQSIFLWPCFVFLLTLNAEAHTMSAPDQFVTNGFNVRVDGKIFRTDPEDTTTRAILALTQKLAGIEQDILSQVQLALLMNPGKVATSNDVMLSGMKADLIDDVVITRLSSYELTAAAKSILDMERKKNESLLVVPFSLRNRGNEFLASAEFCLTRVCRQTLAIRPVRVQLVEESQESGRHILLAEARAVPDSLDSLEWTRVDCAANLRSPH